MWYVRQKLKPLKKACILRKRLMINLLSLIRQISVHDLTVLLFETSILECLLHAGHYANLDLRATLRGRSCEQLHLTIGWLGSGW